MNKSELKQLIKEVYLKKSQSKCNCGCDTCENVGNPGVVLNESLVNKNILSENLQYHIDNKLPLTENTFRYGSKSFLDLWAEARALYVREMIYINDLDKEILEETDLGNYGVYEGQKVPLDLPMMEEKIPGGLASKLEGSMEEKHQQLADMHGVSLEQIESQLKKGVKVELEHTPDKDVAHEIAMDHVYEDPKYYDKLATIEEAEYQGKDIKLNKPKRGGSKAYYVYVRDPKTKKIKKVSFGSGGLKAKINNPKARRAFAKRHNCDKKKDKTKAGYWSCRLPRYAKALGLKSSYSGYW